MADPTVLMTASEIDATLRRMAQAVVDRTTDPAKLALIGIRTGGVHIARRLTRLVEAALGASVQQGSLDITLYRDDLYSGAEKPSIGPTDIRFDIDELEVILVDDVLFTGRTIRAALHQLVDLGRPRRIQLAVLVDRGHRELPIMADIIGRTIATTLQQRVKVHLQEDARYSQDQVVLIDAPSPGIPATP